MNLDQRTESFYRVYQRNKKDQELLKARQRRLFNDFTRHLHHQSRMQKTVIVPVEVDLTTWIKQHHSGWRLVNEVEHYLATDKRMALIEEDTALMKFTYVNKQLGMVFGRDVIDGSPSLDDDQLRADDPALWERITEWPEPWWSLVRTLIERHTSLRIARESLDASAAEHLQQCGVTRVLKDLNTLGHADLVRVQQYIIPGQKSVRLRPPRPVKPEELEDME